MLKFRITHFVPDYVKVGDEYRHVEVESKYTVTNHDDLTNLLLTLIDFGGNRIKFAVDKEEVTE